MINIPVSRQGIPVSSTEMVFADDSPLIRAIPLVEGRATIVIANC